MYGILSEGKIIQLCDEPRYVKIHETNGCYVQCNKEDAIALSVNGTLYNINNEEKIEGASQAIATEIEVSEYIFDNKIKSSQNEHNIIKIEDAVCELDVAKDSRMASIEDALCELDSVINGGENL